MGKDTTTILIQYHFDAVSVWLHKYGYYDTPGKHSRGLFGVNVGAPRVLDLHDRLDIPSTWFIPGHTVDSFPDVCADVWEAGHDIQNHGWAHADQSSFDSKEDVIEDLKKGNESIESLTGREPKGYSSSRIGVFTTDTIEALQELGFEWDSSLMGNDFKPYFLPKGWEAKPGEKYRQTGTTDIIEFPVSWRLDDTPYFLIAKGHQTGRPIANEKDVFYSWRAQFDWMYDHIDNGFFNLMMHPQFIGQAPFPAYLEELLQYMRSKPRVEFKTFTEAVKDLKENPSQIESSV